jgi:hypothetical protein
MKRLLAVLPLMLWAGAARAEPNVAPSEDRSWHLLQRQVDGLIRSVTHGLTKHECEFAAARAMGEPATDEEKAAAKKASDERVAREKAEEDRWNADHPGCNRYYPSKDDPKGKCDGLSYPSLFTGGGMWSSTVTMPTNISSAECFQ